MTVDDVAAYFVAYRDDGLTKGEQKLFACWLAAHDSHAGALNRAEAAWQWFDQVRDGEILTAMRVHARRSGPRRGPHFGGSLWRCFRPWRH